MSRSAYLVFLLAALVLPSIPALSAPPDPDLLKPALAGPLADVKEIVFAMREFGRDGHWYANFGYYCLTDSRKAYGSGGGKLCKLDIRTGKVTNLIDDPEGGVRDPQVSYDGKRIIFSWRKAGTENYNLYEINCDGTSLRRLTDAPFDDIEPCYLPDGDITFVSTRCKRWVNCWLTQVAVMYRCDAEGKHIRILSSNIEQDNTPWPLPDGRVIYTRWEYVDRSQLGYHQLWVSNPDGTGVMTMFGNMNSGTVIIDAKPIPNTDKLIAIFSPGHGRTEHQGAMTIIDPKGGPDEVSCTKTLNKGQSFRDPFPLSEDCFLVAEGPRLLLMNQQGQTQTIYSSDKTPVHEPRPIIARPRETIIAPKVDLMRDTGTVILSDVNHGRNMEGIKPGDIKKLLVLETLPKPVNFTGGTEPLSHGGTFTLERILGTVPVEADGSAYVEIPAMRPVFFVALDANDMAIKRMQSFMSVQPGETLSCAGCHEQRYQAAPPRGHLAALTRAPSRIEPIADVPDVIDDPRDVQPVLDAHCVKCHSADKPEGGVNLSGHRGPIYSHSFYTMFEKKLVSDGRNNRGNLPPRSIGSSASHLMTLLDGKHYDAKASVLEQKRLRLWIETGAAYPGTYAALFTGMLGGYDENRLVLNGTDDPAVQAAAQTITRRCASCHTDKIGILPRSPWDDTKNQPWLGIKDRISRHAIFDLTEPAKSILLKAPLAKIAGGYDRCAGKTGQSVFTTVEDPDYRLILSGIHAAKQQLDQIKRFDMPGFIPNDAYIREMKRFGILPESFRVGKDAINAYEVDRKYWRSLWWTAWGREN